MIIKSLYFIDDLIKRFISSEKIVNQHLKNDFGLFLLFVYQIRFLHTLSLFFVIIQKNPHSVYVFGIISIIHSLTIIGSGLLNGYIILFCNTPTTEIFIQSVKTVLTLSLGAYGFHQASTIPIIPPNQLTNLYHIHSPTGRGYGLHSSGQALIIDGLKTALGNQFDYEKIIDNDKMVEPTKLKKYVKNYKKEILENVILSEEFKKFMNRIDESQSSS